MNKIVFAFILPFILLSATPILSQSLKAGFDPGEYQNLLKLAFLHADTPWSAKVVPPPAGYTLRYRSTATPMFNRWDLWTREDGVVIISIRGTVGQMNSWMENFYAGMIPATGTLKFGDSSSFRYRLAKDSNAYVHAGWTLGLAGIAPDIVQHIKDYYQRGSRQFIITGHSQGGAISFLLRSYLAYIDDPSFPKDIVFKTYCSAAPKPGNQYYAYDFDYLTREGWAFRVVNARDWVPETPFSIQTTRDFNQVNAFMNVKGMLRSRPFFIRLVLGHVYGSMDRSSKKASRRMQKYLGKILYKRVKQVIPQYEQPPFVSSHHYATAGAPVILYPVAGYHERFPFDGKNIFVHHMYAPYQYLLEQIYSLK